MAIKEIYPMWTAKSYTPIRIFLVIYDKQRYKIFVLLVFQLLLQDAQGRSQVKELNRKKMAQANTIM